MSSCSSFQRLHQSEEQQQLVGAGRKGGGYGMGRIDEVRNSNKDMTMSCRTSLTARAVLVSRPSGVLGDHHDQAVSKTEKQMVKKAKISKGIIFPWMKSYKIWWFITAIGAIVTVFIGPFEIAFQDEPGTFNDAAAIVEVLLTYIYTIDIVVNFNLAYYDKNTEVLVFERMDIITEYMKCMFWVDLIGVFPFERVALVLVGELGQSTREALLFSLLRLLRFVRLHRMKKLSDILQYDARISLLWFTLIRNFAAVLCTSHLAACCMYFIARLHSFDPETTWIGSYMNNYTTGFQRYMVSLYWSVVTFCTVGYGDFDPVNTSEQICGVFFMLLNIVVAAWIIGSITLLVVKGDEGAGEFRDTLTTLDQYSRMHRFDETFTKSLQTQLRLEFNNREISDESVLQNFPSAVRRKILRKLYLQPLMSTQLMEGVRPQFIDAFLASCKVEIVSAGEIIVERGSILSDLFLLVGGIAEITTTSTTSGRSSNSSPLSLHSAFSDDDDDDDDDDFFFSSGGDRNTMAKATADISKHTAATATANDDTDDDDHLRSHKIGAGEFIGEIGFFTESPQVDSVACLTVCKTLTMSQSAYKLLAQDHPGSVGKILNNLLAKVEDLQMQIPKNLSVLRAGSVYDPERGYGSVNNNVAEDVIYEEIELRERALTSIKDLVKMHMSKQLDDQTTRFCFAASRGDTSTISLMCDQGFDPNNADYDTRTALMVASMKGNTDVVRLLLEYKANPNITDMHNSTALLEAVKNGHETTMNVLFEHGAELCMEGSRAAYVLCQAVYDGDILLLKRLLRAGIDPNAADYDKRTAAHIAAAEGNVAAIRVLAENGANLTLEDRWSNTVQEEAERSNARQLLEFLDNNNVNNKKKER